MGERNAYLKEKILGWRIWQIFAAVGVLGAVLVAFGVYIFWYDYSFQQEKVSGSATILDKTYTTKRLGKYSVGTSYQLHCKLVSDSQNLQCWLNDKHDHWRSIRSGDQVQILFRKSNPTDMRLLSDFDFRPVAGILYCASGLLVGACGGVPLAAPISVWLRQRLGIVNESSKGPTSRSE